MKINRYENRLDEIQEELELDGIEIGKVDNEYKAAFLCYQLLKGKAQESSVVYLPWIGIRASRIRNNRTRNVYTSCYIA